jgi:hypothetical protein
MFLENLRSLAKNMQKMGRVPNPKKMGRAPNPNIVKKK